MAEVWEVVLSRAIKAGRGRGERGDKRRRRWRKGEMECKREGGG